MRAFLFACLLVAGFVQPAQASGTVWTFMAPLEPRYGENDDKDFGGFQCGVSVTELQADGTLRKAKNVAIVSLKQAQVLRQRFKVDKNSQLVGRSFHSKFDFSQPGFLDTPLGSDDVFDEISLLVAQTQHGDKYVSPSYDEIYERMALSLAARVECTFLDVDNRTVRSAIKAARDTKKEYYMSDEWFAKLNKRVGELSNGRVKLERRKEDGEEFWLSSGTLRQRFGMRLGSWFPGIIFLYGPPNDVPFR